ncbi:MAG: S8 family serine peptidase [Anaerolineae bacterium]
MARQSLPRANAGSGAVDCRWSPASGSRSYEPAYLTIPEATPTAQERSSLTTVVKDAVGGTLEVTVSDIPRPDLTANHLITHGDAVQVQARLNETPLPLGSPLPIAVSITLAYPQALPADVPDERLLAVFYSDGISWSRLDCTAGACQQSLANHSFQVAASNVGNYVLAAPRLATLGVSPQSVSLRPGESIRFSALVTDTGGNPVVNPPVSWQANPTVGTIDAQGNFRATGIAGQHTAAVTATLGSLTDSADVTITWWNVHLPFVLARWSAQRWPNDPYYAWQWNMEHVQAPKAWGVAIGDNGPIIAVLDTGIDLAHPDLVGNLVPGWDFVNGDSSPQDDNGHGTHVTGITAAIGNNGLGVAGMNWKAQIMPIKILDQSGVGEAAKARLGIHWAIDHGARVLNLSLGTYDTSPDLEEAVSYALSKGAIIVAAVGNVGSASGVAKGTWIYPAAYPGVLGVGATDSSDRVADFSNQGPFVDAVAPGVYVLSTFVGNSYAYFSGTSMATPHVAGLAALIWSVRPSLTTQAVVKAITDTAQDLGTPGWDATFGYGLIDAGTAVSYAVRANANVTEAAEERYAAPKRLAVPPPGSYKEGVVLVRLAAGFTAEELATSLSQAEMQLQQEPSGLPNVIRVHVPVGSESEFMKRLSALPGVISAQLDYLLFAM